MAATNVGLWNRWYSSSPNAGPGMVTRWFLMVQFIDPDGESRYYGDGMEGQTAIETLGLAHAVIVIESERIRRNHFEEES